MTSLAAAVAQITDQAITEAKAHMRDHTRTPAEVVIGLIDAQDHVQALRAGGSPVTPPMPAQVPASHAEIRRVTSERVQQKWGIAS